MVEPLFKSVQDISLYRGLLYQIYHLTVELDLENTRVHEKLHCVGVEQVLAVS